MNISVCLTVQLAHTVVIKAKCDALFWSQNRVVCLPVQARQIQFLLESPASLTHISVTQP